MVDVPGDQLDCQLDGLAQVWCVAVLAHIVCCCCIVFLDFWDGGDAVPEGLQGGEAVQQVGGDACKFQTEGQGSGSVLGRSVLAGGLSTRPRSEGVTKE